MKASVGLLVLALMCVWLPSEAKRSSKSSMTAIPALINRPMSDEAGKNKKEEVLDCGRHMVKPGTSVTFKSKNYPDGYKKGKCTWLFRTKKGAALTMQCNDFKLEETTNCKKDFLQINDYSGGKKKYCGLQKSAIKSKSASRLQVKFKASKDRSFKGFTCTVESRVVPEVPRSGLCAPLSCGIHYVAPGSSLGFQSENYPNNYPDRTSCTWDFITDEGATLNLYCDDFSVQNSRNCKKDFLQITDFTSFNDKYCGSSQDLSVSGESSILQVFFRTNRRKSSTGFCCAVTATVPQTPDPSVTPAPSDCSCGRVNRRTRIVGGTETEVNEYPWMTGLISNGYFICGGAIIADEWVLTAAHCAVIMDTRDGVFIGDHDYSIATEANAQLKELSQVIVHPQYNPNTLDNDIALLKLASKIEWPADNTIAPVCLPSAGESYSNMDAIVTGWGAQSESGRYLPQLYEVTVPTLTNVECNTRYNGGISDNMICAGVPDGGKDSCQGDSGGPMITDENGQYVEIGIVSWGIGCARPRYPGVYARVNNFLPWINSYISTSGNCAR
ncbi:venom serine protease 34-like [Penaeus japonicus]|uniref:venom serine protease 34-like n=1 Tax=Penaeus japonicus TaxID=27405 RepID=UPI001C713603|nr:venom serine protease 34-like [Penaeus japonicus]